jgi:EF-P beta-lysylation protein EpmB
VASTAHESVALPAAIGPDRTAAGPTWQRLLRDAVRDPFELCRLLDLPEALAHQAAATVSALRDPGAALREPGATGDSSASVPAAGFPIFAPRGYIARMRPGDPHDPLLRQVLPLESELAVVQGFANDPVGDLASQQTPGLLRKYAGRALIVTTGACAVHCRYCFRRHFPYQETPRGLRDWTPALEAVAADPSLDEVILSGGDPLTLVDPLLRALALRVARIDHVRRLRVHTRLPIVLPERVCDELLGWLRGTRLTPIVVVHANHPAEINAAVAAALTRLVEAGVVVLNQAVLLRGVNDALATQLELCRRLVNLRVLPYYLHQLDRVAGAAHFEASEEAGRRIMEGLRAALPGYAVPRYVRETPGAAHKLPLE